jgi:hypothetical protein
MSSVRDEVRVKTGKRLRSNDVLEGRDLCGQYLRRLPRAVTPEKRSAPAGEFHFVSEKGLPRHAGPTVTFEPSLVTRSSIKATRRNNPLSRNFSGLK